MAEQVGALIEWTEVRNGLTGADADSPDTIAFKNAVAKKLCLGGAALYMKASHDVAAGESTVSAAFYDIEDNYIGLRQFSLNALAAPSISGRFESNVEAAAIPGAHSYRLHLSEALVNSANVNLFAGFLDGVPLR